MDKKLEWSAVIIKQNKADPGNTTPQRTCGWKGQEGFLCGFSIFPTHRHCGIPKVSLGQSPQVSQYCEVRAQNWTLFRLILLTLCAIIFFWLAGLQLPPALLAEHVKKKGNASSMTSSHQKQLGCLLSLPATSQMQHSNLPWLFPGYRRQGLTQPCPSSSPDRDTI